MNSEPTETSWQLRFDHLAVADVMTMDPVTVGVDATLEAAEQLLAAYRISGLPVVDGAGQLVGVLSRTDLLLDGGFCTRGREEITVYPQTFLSSVRYRTARNCALSLRRAGKRPRS